ncbi:dihydroorotate dehydrogenase [Zophobihabitans entericus]|uniref:Dihydroorotate dehydrogenase n=1 Tax=Zophobihabitans entericus TaxID=1635327 RepID=A0A6G9IAD9_9GAMM|nr:dihydroorotate dehydrogenase [Zophobihabitans entericus]QIQ21183.1 dihydroorotate dehydrogenase [Zophobihabitans entericus]
MIDLSVNINGLTLQNPIMPASGTFDTELASIIDFNQLGALVTKTFTHDLRAGNPVPRACELPSGMLNAIGIPSKGVDYYLEHVVPFYRQFSSPLITSISANTSAEFAALAAQLDGVPGIAGIEANISCPNIEAHGKAFAMEAESTAKVVKALRQATKLPLWVKLTPNTSDIASVAQAAEAEGADALIVGNTILAMAIDIHTRRPKLGNIMGGYSGPAIKPIMIRMTYQCYKKVNIPIIGCGGISSVEDVIEYFLAGATAVQVGTTSFIQPSAMTQIIDELKIYCLRHNIKHVSELTGAIIDEQFEALTALPY